MCGLERAGLGLQDGALLEFGPCVPRTFVIRVLSCQIAVFPTRVSVYLVQPSAHESRARDDRQSESTAQLACAEPMGVGVWSV